MGSTTLEAYEKILTKSLFSSHKELSLLVKEIEVHLSFFFLSIITFFNNRKFIPSLFMKEIDMKQWNNWECHQILKNLGWIIGLHIFLFTYFSFNLKNFHFILKKKLNSFTLIIELGCFVEFQLHSLYSFYILGKLFLQQVILLTAQHLSFSGWYWWWYWLFSFGDLTCLFGKNTGFVCCSTLLIITFLPLFFR